MKKISVIVLFIMLLFSVSCSSTKSVKFRKMKLAKNANVAVIIDSKQNIKNVVLATFLKKGFKVKAFNATDLYSRSDIFDIKDYKKISYEFGVGEKFNLLSLQKSYSNIYKLHLYNFEVNKAESLAAIKARYNIRYLVLLELKDWENVSWGRAIDLNNFDIVWLENYPTKYSDNLETVVNHFIDSMSN